MNNSQSVELKDMLPVLIAMGVLACVGLVGLLLA
jgi:hypothetical protein